MQTTAEHTDAAPASGPERADHFETLGLPRKLGLDAAALKRAFHDLSRRHHPDLVHERGPEARARAVALATRINDAFNCLKDRLRRAEHLLGLEGRVFESKTDRIPPRFFDLVMEVNMAAAGARSGDAAALKTLT
ncbi:MAG: DnaJ domain-containing protein, partial [Candidatus Methylomirabilis sp.]|nr:DnaJ domain-containing protein [Deltaproteobacteria bacterium]